MSIFARAKAATGVWPDSTAPIGEPTFGCVEIADAPMRELVRVTGKIRAIRMQPQAGVPTLHARIDDGTGELTVVFLGRRQIPGIEVGRVVVAEGVVSEARIGRQMLNPVYRLL